MKIGWIAVISFLLFANTGNSQGIYQLFGQTPYGGAENGGVIFTTNSSGGNFQTRYDFRIGPNDGAEPWYTKLAAFNGKFYGMTLTGGNNNKGVIFEYDPATGIYTKKIDFGGTTGASPYGSLVLFGSKFYGMTSAGGTSSKGVLFEWDPVTNGYTVKYNFNANGDSPYGNITVAGGLLFGMTRFGGINLRGVIFQFDPATNIYTKKIDLSATLGSYPEGSLTYSSGMFYGTTVRGGTNELGVIFQWDPATNIYTKKFDFASTTNGNYPIGSMAEYAGKFYGMTFDGGSGGGGVIYEWEPVGNTYTRKFDLTPATGYKPTGELLLYNNKFYGLTLTNNSTGGSIFEWDPATNTLLKKIDLDETRGSSASGTMLLSGTKMYGLTRSGGADNLGTLFEWDPGTNVFTKKADLGGKDDKYPTGTLVSLNGKLYGACTKGGTNGIGLLFEWDPATSTYTKKYSFSVQDGRNPNSSLTLLNDKFYGMTSFGGAQDGGVLFEWDPAGNVYTKKADLTASTGTVPYGDLTSYNNKLYGMTSTGNAGNTGTIFEWDPATNIIIKKIDFTGPTGYHPFGSLSLYNNKFYGTTLDGGSNFLGTIFEWEPSGNTISAKHNFTVAGGNRSYGTMTLENNIFYGVTYFGGANSAGVLFDYDPVANVYTPRYNFASSTGSNPQAGLTLSGSKFYGITRNGGSNSRGVIFEWDPVSNGYSKKYDFSNFSSALYYNNNFLRVPAFVGNGVANNCSNVPSITINSSNNTIWVPITDLKGDAIGEINANGNNLGLVSTSFYINNGPVREDAQFRLYLDRNISITPQVQPSTPVDIRLYLKKSEFEALKAATNSQGQPSGVNTIADLQLFKNNDPCSPVIVNSLNTVPVTAAQWGDNYVLSASISSFSSFYLAKNAIILPVTLSKFTGLVEKHDAVLSWTAATELNLSGYEVERSFNGADFTVIGNRIAAANTTSVQHYQYEDQQIFDRPVRNVYYRLKIIDQDNRISYSAVIVLSLKENTEISTYPNPCSQALFLEARLSGKQVQFLFYNSVGLLMRSESRTVALGRNLLEFNVSGFPKGVYYLRYSDENEVKTSVFMKE